MRIKGGVLEGVRGILVKWSWLARVKRTQVSLFKKMNKTWYQE